MVSEAEQNRSREPCSQVHVHEKMDHDLGRDKVGSIVSYCAVVEAVCGGSFRIVDRFQLGAIDRARAGQFHLDCPRRRSPGCTPTGPE